MTERLPAQTVEAWHDALVQLMPVGRAWDLSPKSNHSKLLKKLATALAKIDSECDAMALETLPSRAFQLLNEWEAYLGLPGCSFDLKQTIVERRWFAELKDKFRGGFSVFHIEALATDLGFDVTVKEVFPHHCLRDCLYPLYPPSTRHTINITVNNMENVHMTCLDDCMTPLIKNNDARVLECILNKYKMAGKYYIFTYNTGGA